MTYTFFNNYISAVHDPPPHSKYCFELKKEAFQAYVCSFLARSKKILIKRRQMC